MSAIHLEHISKKFGRKTALGDITVDIPETTFTTVLGPPGAGKTTLLRILAGLERADSGKIIMNGVDVSQRLPGERGVSFVAQDFALYPHMNVFRNISYPLRLRKTSRDEIKRKVTETARFLKIDKLLDREPTQLSGGEQQRVAIARGLVKDARLYLFDEPLTNLDYKIREDMRAEFRKIQHETGQTIVYATSDSIEAISMSEYLIVMNEGQIVEVGKTTEVYAAPKSLFTATYFGYPPMNTLPAKLGESEGGFTIDAGIFSVNIKGEKPRFKCSKPVAAVRPERLVLADRKPDTDAAFSAKIVLSDVIGSDTIVYLKPENHPETVKAFVPSTYRALPGHRVWVGLASRDLFIYDADSGLLAWKGEDVGSGQA
ncbi:MAG TPA: ABC transporter ATP-binding protein [Firmicutes bacterium]|nr:ABC transporter ATP-binding protein [Bacillota bacterium]